MSLDIKLVKKPLYFYLILSQINIFAFFAFNFITVYGIMTKQVVIFIVRVFFTNEAFYCIKYLI